VIPPQHADQACLPDHHPGETSVLVDRVEARFALLEAENRQLRQQLDNVTNDYQLRLQRLEGQYNETCE
jgi:hypothetical protein